MKRISYIIILQLLLTFNYCNSQWYQINLPVAGSVYQMQFINSNTGWAVISQTNVGYILIRTTNQGTNWFVIYSDSSKVGKFQFLNDTLGYSIGYSQGYHLISKTTNGGYNWTVMQSSFNDIYNGFYMINADTGWVNTFRLPTTITLRTTNGFQTLEQISTGSGGTPATLYFFKEKYNGEYCGYVLGAGTLSKTTNSGYNWQDITFTETGDVNSFSFTNKDTGWVVFNPNIGNNSKILYTSNNGQNWVLQNYSSIQYDFGYIQAVNKYKVWCGKGAYSRVAISTTGGTNWGYQISANTNNSRIYFYDSLLGFAWSNNQIARTLNGGGQIIGINQISTEVPEEYSLGQNFPNPFNPTTNIPFELKEPSHVTLKVFDARGREVKELVNGRWGTGKFIADFDASQFATGIYFYQIIVSGETTHQTFAETRKMMVLK